MDVAVALSGVDGTTDLADRLSDLIRLVNVEDSAASSVGLGRFFAGGGVPSTLRERSFFKASLWALDGSASIAATMRAFFFLYLRTTILEGRLS
jgi:hypothetical protein